MSKGFPVTVTLVSGAKVRIGTAVSTEEGFELRLDGLSIGGTADAKRSRPSNGDFGGEVWEIWDRKTKKVFWWAEGGDAMSTKALREALKELGYHATTDCQSAAGAEETQRKLDAAVGELNAIERAAKEWCT